MLVALGLLAALGLAASGCGLLFRDRVSARRDFLLTNPLDKKSPRDRFYEFRGKKKTFDVLDPPLGVAVAPLYLRQPFSVEAEAGIFDLDELAGSDGAVGCLELDEVGFYGIAGHFFVLCLQYLLAPLAGVNVYTPDESTFYPGVNAGTLRMESDATTLDYLFQPRGSLTWDPIDSIAFDNADKAYFPSVGGAYLKKGGVVDFGYGDWETTPLASPTLAEAIGEAIEAAMQQLNRACYALDGAAPDFNIASTYIQNSFPEIISARTDLASLPDLKFGRQVLKKLDCLDSNAGKALNAVLDQRVDSAIKKIEKAERCGGDGLIRLRDFKIQF
jgi:hypothetical protein